MTAPLGIIAGNGAFPQVFAREAQQEGHSVIAVCHKHETDPAIEQYVDEAIWIKLGELGKLISAFQDRSVQHVAMAGGINRVKWFGGVKLDLRGAALLAKIRSMKDDRIMRGIADELEQEGIEVIACTTFLQECLVEEGPLTSSRPSAEEEEDIRVGVEALRAMSSQDIGQLVVVREGVVVAVEAVEGTDSAIRRGGELGGKGAVVVKYAKPTQDMRFDVPTVGPKTIETMIEVKARVLALETGRTLMMERERTLELANKKGLSIVGSSPLV